VAERDDSQERTEQPTPKRLREAREKGQVARSRELNTLAVLLAGAGLLLMLAGRLGAGMVGVMRDGLGLERGAAFDPGWMLQRLHDVAMAVIQVFAPLLALLAVVALLAPLALGGWSLSAKAMAFKGERLNPLKGLKRVFGVRGLMELLKAVGKFLVIGAMGVGWLWSQSETLLALGLMPVESAIPTAGRELGLAFLVLACALIVIAAIDVPFQIWDHQRNLKMTRQEVRDELKETEGRPEVRGRIRALQREMAQRRMMAQVPRADVVITNPTHYAVALKYDPQTMDAPVLLAKGADLVALRIRELGEASGVPRVEAAPLARALFHSTELDQAVPVGLYVAVAQVLAYVYQLRQGRARQGRDFDDLPIPEDLRR
jgi:flagellar biosynthetic protein FlhB